jgi:intracellular sulfur oxidation DsrE/DsrF family protein
MAQVVEFRNRIENEQVKKRRGKAVASLEAVRITLGVCAREMTRENVTIAPLLNQIAIIESSIKKLKETL